MGLFSRKKKSQGNIHIRGFLGHVDTCKCLYLVAEKGVSIDFKVLDVIEREHEAGAYLSLSPFGKIPCLGEGDTVISGVAAILPYLDIKGSGQSLTPRKAAHLGEQNYWVEVGQNQVLPHVDTLLDEHILKPMADDGYTPDNDKVNAAISELDRVFTVADKQLEAKDYFAGSFTFADIHWAPYLHFCEVTGHGDLLNERPHLKQWFDLIKSRRNGSKNTFDALPGLDQIKNKSLRDAA